MSATKILGSAACVTIFTTTHVPLIGARDIKAMRSPGAMFDSSDRSIGIQTSIPTRFAPSIEFKMLWNGGAGATAIRDAYVNGTALYAAYLNGAPGTSAKGMKGDWAVTKFPLDFPLLDGQPVDIELKPHGNYTHTFDFAYIDAAGLGTPETPVAKKLGTKAVLLDGSSASITAVRGLKLTLESGGEVDASDRLGQVSATDSNVYFIQMTIPVRKKWTIEGDFIADESNAQLTDFRTKFLGGLPKLVSCLDGIGGWGVTGDHAIAEYVEEAMLVGELKVSFKLTPHGNWSNQPGFTGS